MFGIFTALLASALLGVTQVNASKKSAKQAARRQEQQLAAQKTAAKEAAQQQTTREETGAKVKLGSDDEPVRSSGGRSGKNAASRTGSVRAAVGGVKPTKRLGL